MNEGFNLDGYIRSLVKVAVAETVAQLAHDGAATGMKPRLLTVKEAAVYLGRSKSAVHHLIEMRRIPFVRDGRRVLLDVQQLDAWIRSNTELPE